jgi:hypothetical protein
MERERISWEEAEAVVRLWRKRNGAPRHVNLSSVASSLGIGYAEAEELLIETRTSSQKRRFVDRSGVWSAGLAAAAMACIGIVFAVSSRPTISVSAFNAPSAPKPLRLNIEAPTRPVCVVDGEAIAKAQEAVVIAKHEERISREAKELAKQAQIFEIKVRAL